MEPPDALEAQAKGQAMSREFENFIEHIITAAIAYWIGAAIVGGISTLIAWTMIWRWWKKDKKEFDKRFDRRGVEL